MVAPVNFVARGAAASMNQKSRAADQHVAGANAAQANPAMPHRHHEDSPVLRVEETADNIGNGLWTAEFFVPMVATPIAWLAGKIPFVGDKAKAGVELLLKKPFEKANAITVGDVVNKVKGGAPVAALHGSVPNMAAFEKQAVAATTGAFKDNTWLARQAGKKATGAFTAMHKDLGEMLGGGLGKQGGGFFSGVTNRVKGLFGKKVAAVAHTTPAHLVDVEKHLSAFHGAIAGEAHLVDTAAASKHLGAAMTALHGAKVGPEHHKAVNALGGELSTMQQRLHQAGNLATSARGHQTLAGAVKNGTKGMSLRDVGVKGGLGIGVLYYGSRTVTGFRDNLAMLKEMNSDITGKPTSTMDVLRGNLDGLAIPARSNMLSRFGPEALTAAASAITNLVFMRRHMGGMAQAAMFGAMGVQMSVAEFMPKENYLDAYFAVKDMRNNGMEVPLEAYAELIAAASKDAQEAGGASSRLVMKVAEEYAERGVDATTVLKEIHGKTQFQKRAEAAFKKMAAEDEAAREEVAEQMDASEQAPAQTDQAPAAPQTAMLAASAAQHDGKLQARTIEKAGV